MKKFKLTSSIRNVLLGVIVGLCLNNAKTTLATTQPSTTQNDNIFSDDFFNNEVCTKQNPCLFLKYSNSQNSIEKFEFNANLRAVVDDCKSRLDNLMNTVQEEIDEKIHLNYLSTVVDLLSNLMYHYNGGESNNADMDEYRQNISNMLANDGEILLTDKIQTENGFSELRWEIESKNGLKIQKKARENIKQPDGSTKQENSKKMFSYSYKTKTI